MSLRKSLDSKPWYIQALVGVIGAALTIALLIAVTPLEKSWGAAAASTAPAAKPDVTSQQRPACGRSPDDIPCGGVVKRHVRSAKHFRALYRHNKLNAVSRVHYPKALKRIILRKAHHKWNLRHAKCGTCLQWNASREWEKFTSKDTCVAAGYPSNMVAACTPQTSHMFVCTNDPHSTRPKCNWPAEPAWFARARIRVVYCAGTLLPAIFTGGSWLWTGWGGGMCLGQFAVD